MYPFQYSIVRVVPDIERGESLNAGVITYCRAVDFLQALTQLDPFVREQLLRAGIDPEQVAGQLSSIEQIARGTGSSPIASLPLSDRFNWLAAASSTTVQPSPALSGVTADPALELDALFDRLVARRSAAFDASPFQTSSDIVDAAEPYAAFHVADLHPRLSARTAHLVAEAERSLVNDAEADVEAFLRADAEATLRFEGLDDASIVSYRAALERATSLQTSGAQWTIGRLLDLHSQLGDLPSPGHLRDRSVWIGHPAEGSARARFVAPDVANLDPLLEDLVTFMNRSDLPRVVHAAVAHAQFVTIHPFLDGNGRIGRIVAHALLNSTGQRAAVPFSVAIAQDRSAYFRALTAYQAGSVNRWVEWFARALTDASAWAERGLARLDG